MGTVITRSLCAERGRRSERGCAGIGLLVLPITLGILIGLFLVQSQGSGFIARICGPIMLAWFIVIGILGLRGVMLGPGILAALNPLHAVDFLIQASPRVSLAVMGAAFLAVTGGEAMYADLGHFGRTPVRFAWDRAAGNRPQLFRSDCC